MFGKKDIEIDKMETVIGPDARFQGNVRSKGFVRVDGIVDGSVSAEGVIVGEKAAVTGDVTAKRVYIGGKVTGNIIATTSLELQPKGQILGDIRTAQLSIADGSVFEGHCTMAADKVGAVDIDKLLETASA